MRKTLFAGLTVLNSDESLVSDGGAFIGRDRDTIDRMLEIGAKTHRHNGQAGLANPADPLTTVQIIPSGGALDANTTFTLGYTLEDEDGGETVVSPQTSVTTPGPLNFPEYAPVAEMEYDNGGNLLIETYYYALTFVDNEGGETPTGAWAQVEREPGFEEARVLLSNLDAGVVAASATGWRLYRAVGGGTYDYLASGTGGAYVDDGSVSVNCDIHPPPDEVNTTNQISQLRVVLPSAVGDASTINLYASDSGELVGDVLLDSYPVSSAGQTVFFTEYEPGAGMPPDTNQSIGGASMIDPDTEILDWHWKRPVEEVPQLGSGARGDVRLVKTTGEFWGILGASALTSAEWTKLASGGVGGGSALVVSEDGGAVVTPVGHIEFDGAVVTDEGDAHVKVTIPPGGDADAMAIRQVRASGGTAVPNPSAIVFSGSGNALVDAFALGGGSAHVRITAIPVPGPTGDPGPSGTPGRLWASAAITLGSGSTGTIDFAGSAAGIRLLQISTSKRARVRVYGQSSKRSADSSRPIGTAPSGDHGVLLDFANTAQASGTIGTVSPAVDAHNLDTPAVNLHYLTVDNFDASGSVTVAFLYVPTEIVP